MEYDSIVFEKILPFMGLPEAFHKGGEYRGEYRRMTRMALCKGRQDIYESFCNYNEDTGENEDFNYIAPEAATIGIFPCQSHTEPIEMLQPHIDSMNGLSENFNHTITFGGVFCIDDITDEAMQEYMRDFLTMHNVQCSPFVFIRYSIY